MKINPIVELLKAGRIVGISPHEMTKYVLEELARDEELNNEN